MTAKPEDLKLEIEDLTGPRCPKCRSKLNLRVFAREEYYDCPECDYATDG